MKTLVKLVILLAALSIAVPAYGDVLVFALSEKSIISFDKEGGTWDVEKWKEKGALVIEVDDLDAPGGTIPKATVIWYGTDEGGKWYELDALDGVFELVVIDAAKKHWVILLNDEGVYMLVLAGKVKGTAVGLADKKEVAAALKGNAIFDEEDGADREISATQMQAKLDKKRTTKANSTPQDRDAVVAEIEAELVAGGYVEEVD